MKKLMLGLLVTGLLAGGAFAQAPAKKKTVEFVVSAGIFVQFSPPLLYVQKQTDSSGSVGAQCDIHVGSNFLISPELNLFFNDNAIGPGLTFSLLAGKVALGAGVLWLPAIEPEYDESVVYPKVSLGYRGRHLVVTGYAVIGHGYEVGTFIGGTVGYKF
jgi:hypothetical protein